MNGNKLKPEMIFIVVILGLSGIAPYAVMSLVHPEWKIYYTLVEKLRVEEFWILWYQFLMNLPTTLQELPGIDKVRYVGFIIGTLAIPIGGIGGFIYYTTKEKNEMLSAQTSAVYAKSKDLQEYVGKDGVILSKQLRTTRQTCFGHILVVGPTGSGKTVSFFLPNIVSLLPDSSAVITDPKGELYQITGNFHKNQGRRTALLKLDNRYVSECWNPLDLPKDTVTMSKVCTSIVKNKGGDSGGGGDQDFWDATAIDLLMALVYIVKALPGQYGNFRNAYMILSECSFEAILGLARYAVMKTGNKDILSRAASFSGDVAPEDTRNSTRFVLKTALAPFMMEDIAYLTARTTIDFCQLKREPTALYVSMPEHKVEGVKAVLSTLYMQIFDALLDMGQGGRAVFFLLDEFANVGKIIGFPQYIATIRSRNLSVAVCLQSMEQLTRNYSEAEKQEITNNLKTTLVLPGLKEEKTLQYLQNISGKVGGFAKSSKGEDKRTFAKDRLPINEIRELEDNAKTNIHEAIVIMPNKPPFKDIQRRSYLDPEIRKILDTTEKLEFQNHSEEFFQDIADDCFLDPGDIKFIETIGSVLCFDGRIDRIPAEKKEVFQKFESLANLCGIPSVKAVSPDELSFNWPIPEEELSTLGKIGREMIVETLSWMHREKIADFSSR